MADMLQKIFVKQDEFMQMLREDDKLPEYPVDLRTKPGQRFIRETVGLVCEELYEAVATMKNKVHRKTDDQFFDEAHYREELIDAFSYLIEIAIASGMSAAEFYEEYSRKNSIVKKKFEDGY